MAPCPKRDREILRTGKGKKAEREKRSTTEWEDQARKNKRKKKVGEGTREPKGRETPGGRCRRRTS